VNAFFSFVLVLTTSISTIQTDTKPNTELVDDIAWSIGHEGCPVYGTNPATRRADEILPAEKLRSCFLDSQKHNKEVFQRLQKITDADLLQSTKEAVQVAESKYHVKENLGWVLFHEGQLAYFQSLAKSENFGAIRGIYRQLQRHNPNAVNALYSLTDSELVGAVDPERLSVFLDVGDNLNSYDLAKIATYTEATIVTLSSPTTLGELANRIYGSSASAYLNVIASSNVNLLPPSPDGSQTLQGGIQLTIPSLPSPGKAATLPLKSGLKASSVTDTFHTTAIVSVVKIEAPKRGQIETPAKASLQNATVESVASDGQQWYLLSISADKVRRGDLSFLSPPVVSVVGVVDAGVAENHPLIKSVMWALPRELAGPNWPAGSIGYDFFFDSPTPVEQLDNSHGTHVTGLVTGRQLATWLPFFDDAGLSNNVEAFSLKVAGPDGTFDFTFAQNAVDAAISKGIHIFNLSLSGPKSSLLNRELSQDEHKNNTLFVVAAGNADAGNLPIDLDSNPAQLATFRKIDGSGLENFIFVAALADTGKLADFSNYGRSLVQIAAPGVQISSTIYPDTFGLLSGTSQAAPLVTFTAAILKAEKPDMVPLALKHRILNTCDWDESLKLFVENGCKLNLAKAIVCNSDLVELRKDSSYIRADIDRSQFFRGTQIDQSLVRVWIQDESSAIYVDTSGSRTTKPLGSIKRVDLKLRDGERCPNAVASGVCSISISEIRDIVFRLR
jgi:subtilisin family serine protease